MTRVNVTPLIDPELAAAMAVDARQNPAPVPPLDREDIEGLREHYNRGRAFWREGGPEMARVETFTVPAIDGYEIPVRFYYPSASDNLPAIVYLHGGGWILGNLDTHDRVMRELAGRSGCCVVGVDYRLAPEWKFPVPMEDAFAAVDYVLKRGADHGIDTNRVGCSGDSAGGHMSLYVALKLRDESVSPGLRALAPMYMAAGLQDSQSWRMFERPEEGMGIADRKVWMGCLFENPAEACRDPGFDLLRNDLDGLPPTFVMACALDPVLDDSLAFAELLKAADVPVTLRVHEGMLHSFIQFAEHMPKARAALQEVARFVADTLD